MSGIDWREVGLRIVMAIAWTIASLALAVMIPFAVLFGQPQRKHEIGRGLSRTLSGVWDGNGDVTFSAWSYHMVVRGKKWGPFRVRFVDAVTFESGHCELYYKWHKERRLFDYEP